jgi:hypothetical protein
MSEPPRHANGGEPWSEMDIRDQTAAILQGSSLEETAKFLCRSSTKAVQVAIG